MSPTYFTPFISHLPLAHLVLMNPSFSIIKMLMMRTSWDLKRCWRWFLCEQISVIEGGRKEKLKPKHGNRKPLSLNGLVQWNSRYNETPVQSTPGKDLINLSPSVGSQKRVGGKKSRKGQFSHVFGRQCIVGLGVKTVKFTVWSVPEKIWLELSPTSAALPFTWALQSPRLATQIYTKDKEQVNLRSLPFETCKKDNLTRPW